MSSVIRELDVDNRFSPKPSSYDRFNAGLIASILLVAFAVLCLLMVWLFGNVRPSLGDLPPLDPSTKIVVNDNDGDAEHDLDALDGGSDGIEFVALIESVEDAISNQQASEGMPGDGDFGPGIPGDSDPPIPFERTPKRNWKVSYEVDSVEQYKQQLDFFGIEIGVIAKSESDIWRIGGLTSGTRVTQSNRAREQNSLWFAHTKPTLKRWDREIARDSGLVVEGMLFVQFFPEELQSKINALEAVRLEQLGRDLDSVATTSVQFLRSGDSFSISISGFEFR